MKNKCSSALRLICLIFLGFCSHAASPIDDGDNTEVTETSSYEDLACAGGEELCWWWSSRSVVIHSLDGVDYRDLASPADRLSSAFETAEITLSDRIKYNNLLHCFFSVAPIIATPI